VLPDRIGVRLSCEVLSIKASVTRGFFICIKSLITINMKTIKLKPTEFYQFRQLAFAMSIAFVCSIAHGVYIVEANINQLKQLGY